MDSVEVRTLGPEEFPLWDALVSGSPYGTVFHQSRWLISAGRESGVETNLFGAFWHDQLVGGCAIHTHKVAGFFTSATSTLPLTPYGGVILQSHQSAKTREREKDEGLVIKSLLSAIRPKIRHIVTLTMSPQVIDIRPYTLTGWDASVRYCYLSPLTGDIAERLSRKVRWSVNKAKKAGITSRQKWDKEVYWDLTLNTYRKQGRVPPFSRELLFSLMDIIQTNLWGEMWIAETASGDTAAAEIILWDRQMAYRWSAASSDHYRATGATSFLLVDVMTHLQENGYKKFNMMAANTPHLAKFVSGFNPDLIPYYSVRKSWGLFRILNTIRSYVQ